MEKTTKEKIRLGIFVILGTILLVFAAYLIGNRQNMFGKTFYVSAIFKNINGLQKGNNVRFSGVNIGTVNNIKMVNDTTIRVNMIIEDKMLAHIRRDAIATIGSDGLVGSMIVNIIPGKGGAPLVHSGDEIESYSRIAAEDMMSTLNVTTENAALLTADLLKVTQALTKGKGTLGRLLNDTVMATDLQQTIINLKNTSEATNTVIKELNSKIELVNFEESTAGILLSDTVSGGRMRDIIGNLENSSIEIDRMTKDLNAIVGKVKDGKGAINYLATDTTLVSSLEATMKNIEKGTTLFNENTEALKHNFLTRGYFRKLEKQERKEQKQN